MTHSLVMNYGLYKKMEIFVRSLRSLSCTLPMLTQLNGNSASKTRDAQGDGTIPHGRVRRLSVEGYA
jgi:hypothetical protein